MMTKSGNWPGSGWRNGWRCGKGNKEWQTFLKKRSAFFAMWANTLNFVCENHWWSEGWKTRKGNGTDAQTAYRHTNF